MIRQTKLAPDNVQMKKIADPVDVEKQVEVASVALEDYPDVVNDVLGACLAELKNNPEYDESAKTICSSCPNNVQDKTVEKYKRDFEGFSDPYKCLLVQGVCLYGTNYTRRLWDIMSKSEYTLFGMLWSCIKCFGLWC